MSFTASADIDTIGGGSRAVREASRPGHSYFVAGPGTVDLAMLIGPDIAVNRLRAPWLQPPSNISPEDGVVGAVPRSDLKRDIGGFPSVELPP